MSLRDEIYALELHLMDPAVRADPDVAAVLLADDFVEIGKSGTVYTKPDILNAFMTERDKAAIVVSDFALRSISDEVVLVTYSTAPAGHSGGWAARRSSLWQRNGDGWRLVFHQATPV